MPRLEYSWVQNVNNQLIVGCKNSVQSSTVLKLVFGLYIKTCEQVEFIHQVLRRFMCFVSTYIFYSNNLLIYSYAHNPQALLLRTKKEN